MKCYADSSFLAQLLIRDFATDAAISLHRRLGRPVLIYVPVHDLEIPNALRARVFAAAHLRAKDRAAVKRETEAGLRRLANLLNHGMFQRVPIEWDAAIVGAEMLSIAHTGRLGARAMDILHVAIAVQLKVDTFLTCDERQGRLAQAAGLDMQFVTPLA